MPQQERTVAIGVTGSIGSGKTEVCRLFALLGAKVLYADAVAKDLIESHEQIKTKIQKEFGRNIFLSNGSLDRKKMSQIVFRDSASKEKLNAIVHPFVLQVIHDEIIREKKLGKHSLIVVEAALLYESGADKMLDYLIVVDADEEKQIHRVMQRDGMGRKEVLRRIKAQMPAGDKIKRADFVIHNSDTLESLRTNCTFLFKLLTEMSSSKVVRKRNGSKN